MKDKLLLIVDSHNNVNLIRKTDKSIVIYNLASDMEGNNKFEMFKGKSLDYDVAIDEMDNIHMIYQDSSQNLNLALMNANKKMKTIQLTREPIPKVYYLNIIMEKERPHIFYFIMLSWTEKKYRLYHHYFDDEWKINIIDEIGIKDLLNPMRIIKYGEDIFVCYYDAATEEQIFIKRFDSSASEWRDRIKLTHNGDERLYLDLMIYENIIHLCYCYFEGGNLVLKYQNFGLDNDNISKKFECTLSNPGSCQDPIFLYYEGNLWISWIEYDNIMSRYSEDLGLNWSPIYLWSESKGVDIVKYKYVDMNVNKNSIDHFFGRIDPHISSIGFGNIDNTVEIPFYG